MIERILRSFMIALALLSWLALGGTAAAEEGAPVNRAVPESSVGISSAKAVKGNSAWQITKTGDASLLAGELLGSGITISNATFQGKPASAGIFSTADNVIGFKNGIILSSGSVDGVPGPNNSPQYSVNNGLQGDSDLNSLIPGYATYDASVLEFDLTVTEDRNITFEYVFASEEYNEYVNTRYNDVFGLFVNGENIAVIPGSQTAVAINTINNGNPYGTTPCSHPEYFVNNDYHNGSGLDTQLDGLTRVLTASFVARANTKNHIKLAVADAGDYVLDSDVFIRADSLVINRPPVAQDQTVSTQINQPVTFTLNASDPDSDPLTYTINNQPSHGSLGTLQGNTVIYTPAPGFTGTDSFTFQVSDGQAGSNIATVTIEVDPPSVALIKIYSYKQLDTGPDWTCEPGFENITAGSQDIAQTAFTLADLNGDGRKDTVTVTVYNAYAGYYNSITLDVLNYGAPLSMQQFTISDNSGGAVVTSVPEDLSGVIYQGKRKAIDIDFYVASTAPEGSDYSFTCYFKQG